MPNARLCSVSQNEHTFPSGVYTVETKVRPGYWVRGAI